MRRSYYRLDGTPIETQDCVVPDNTVKTFVVEIRTNTHVSAETIKNLIQSRYEVTGCTETDAMVFVK